MIHTGWSPLFLLQLTGGELSQSYAKAPLRDDTMDCHSMHHIILSRVQTVQSFNYRTQPSIVDRQWLIFARLISWKQWVALHLGLSLDPIVLSQYTALHHF